MRHTWWRTKRSWPLFSPTFFFFFLFLLFLLRLLLFIHFGESPVRENLFPQYFEITRRYMQKKKFFFRSFLFFYEKKLILTRFFGQRSVVEPGPTPSLEYLIFSPTFFLLILIFTRFFCTASVRSWSLDQPLVPGVFG